MKKILVANIFGIGDVLFTTPLISNLKKGLEDLEVGYLCNERTKDILEYNPDIEKVFVYEKDHFVRLQKESRLKSIKEMFSLINAIRKEKYDAVFDFTLSRKFGFLFFLCGISKRVGLDYKKRGMFLTSKLPLAGFDQKHVVDHYLDLLGLLGKFSDIKNMSLVPDEEAVRWADDYLLEKGINKRRLVAMIPGGGASWGGDAFRKRWIPSGFAKAADNLQASGYEIAILGDKSEKDLCLQVADMMEGSCSLVETGLDLKRYIAFLSKCALVVCNDGGPLHIAVALGTKTVSIFGPVDDNVYGPYPKSDKHKVIKALELPCRPCYNRFKLAQCDKDMECLSGLTPEIVTRSCEELLDQGEV